jgi:hypothetical protein
MLLRESGVDVDQGLVRLERDGVEAAADWASLGSPENYVGYGRAVGFASPGGVVPDEPHVYSPPTGLWRNQANTVTEPGVVARVPKSCVSGPPLKSPRRTAVHALGFQTWGS